MAFRALLRDLGQRATVVVSTHLVEDVGAACSEVALMDAGKIVFHGTPDELTARGEGTGAAGDAPLERGYSAVLARPGRPRSHDRRTSAPVRHRPPRAASAVPLTAARLLRVELRRNAMPWMLPLIAALFWFDSYRPSTAMPPLWVLRTFWNMGQGHTIIDFGPFVAGVAAWMGRGTAAAALTDLVTAHRPAALGGPARHLGRDRDLGGGGLPGLRGRHVRGATPRQGVWGAPPWWSVAVGAAARGRVQRRRVRRRRVLPEPVRRAGGRVRRVPGDGACRRRSGSATPAGGR